MTPAITPGRRAAALRRELGPLAWCALECLLDRSDDGRTTEASVRAVTADLGIAKNTAHRALVSLAGAGLIDPIQCRADDGRFGPGRYRLNLADLLADATTRP